VLLSRGADSLCNLLLRGDAARVVHLCYQAHLVSTRTELFPVCGRVLHDSTLSIIFVIIIFRAVL